MTEKTISILGEEWRIKYQTAKENKELKNCDGYTDHTNHTIYYRKYLKGEYGYINISRVEIRALRHEIVHAFLFESGLWVDSGESSAWSMNEEMVDWIAQQYPKISKVYKSLGIE